MGVEENAEGPAVLQLHRWDSSHIQSDLSEYQEAFLSPTRELLLLHSYQSEALLLPLSRDDSYCISFENCKYECRESVNVSSSSACRPDSFEDFPSISESVEGVSKNGYSAESNNSQSTSFPFISDVNSLAWALCGDTYKQHKEAPFREFLIVVGNSGVIFHAFRQIDEANARWSSEDENKPGRWVEWGPKCSSQCDNEAPGDVSVASGVGGNLSYSGQDSTSHLADSSTSKKWLKSFLSSSKIIKSDGIIRTCFPEKLVLPCSATVISFFVDFRDSILMNFYSGTHSVLDESAHGEKRVQFPVDHISLDSIKSDVNVSASSSYTCFRVFSSWFHCMIGFVLSSGFDNIENSCESQDIAIVVGLLDLNGIQWLYTVKLPQKGMGLEPDWVDFQISDKFLISLNKFGSILLHGAVTGEYIAYLDVLQIHGVKPEKSLSEPDTLSIDGDVLRNKFDDACLLISQARNFSYKRSFRRLIVAPYSCLFSAVDECGVLFIICASDHVPDKYVMVDKILPQYLKLGVLAPWVVGHSNISQQNVFCTSSGREKAFIRDDFGSFGYQHFQNWRTQGMVNQNDLNLNGFATNSQHSCQNISESRCACCIRKLFVPIARQGGGDISCFSSLGVTCLMRRNNIDERSCIVHTSLYIDSKFCDDNCLNRVNKTLNLQSEANVVDEEAVGCIFQGSLYLVTRKGVSVVLPSISLSSNFHTIDSIGHNPKKSTQSTALNLQKSLIYDKLKQLGSSWQVAVVDRIILYEGPDEADKLCLENG